MKIVCKFLLLFSLYFLWFHVFQFQVASIETTEMQIPKTVQMTDLETARCRCNHYPLVCSILNFYLCGLLLNRYPGFMWQWLVVVDSVVCRKADRSPKAKPTPEKRGKCSFKLPFRTAAEHSESILT